jgi:hypothetical protein
MVKIVSRSFKTAYWKLQGEKTGENAEKRYFFWLLPVPEI